MTFAGQNPRTFGEKRWDEGYPGAFDPAHRLRDMDLEGIDVAMVFPSLAGALGGVRDGRLAAAWRAATTGGCSTTARPIRVACSPAAVVPLQDPPAAVAEVEWAAQQGFRCVMVRALPLPRAARTITPTSRRSTPPAPTTSSSSGLHPFPFAGRRVEPGDPAGPGRRAGRATSSWPT